MTGHPLDSWQLAADGVRERDAARVLLIDEDGRALLVRGHDTDQPDRSWWFTVGGGIDPGESAEQAAVREVREETGIQLDVSELVGPVLTRTGVFDFYRETCRQREVFFAARVDSARWLGAQAARSGWTEVEHDVLDELAWLSAAELAAQPYEYFPAVLPEVVVWIAQGWDGTVWHLAEEDERAR